MSTLAEIASAADLLPQRERRALVKQLTGQPQVQPRALDRLERESWMAKLAEFAIRTSTGRHTISVEQILEESREERS